VLDYHSISSTPTGDPYYRFDTKRTELGERLYRLKYRNDRESIVDILDTVEAFVRTWNPPLDGLVPAPASQSRVVQPVVEVTKELAARLNLTVYEGAVVKTKPTVQMKNIDDWSERQRVLTEAIQAGPTDVLGKRILLLDDLIESGSTLRRTADVLLNEKGVEGIYTLVLTRTR
jgi:competence protein ComFC